MDNKFRDILERIGKVVLGKTDQATLALTCLFARGHLLIEDIPGIGKTTLAKVLAKCMGLQFKRVQFTNDLLPGDILGVSVFDRTSGGFTFHSGPIFTQILLADEINRATPKTQSALLEAMEERQVTVEGITRPLTEPFFVIATQNPFEMSGTYPLPESQLDRFLMRIEIGYPDRAAEFQLLKGEHSRERIEDMDNCIMMADVVEIQQAVESVRISDPLLHYLQDILEFTRTSPPFSHGPFPPRGLGPFIRHPILGLPGGAGLRHSGRPAKGPGARDGPQAPKPGGHGGVSPPAPSRPAHGGADPVRRRAGIRPLIPDF